MARIPYVERDSASPEVQEVYRKLESNGAKVLNVYRMAGHSRAALLPMIKLGNSLMTRAELDAKLREIVILRMAVIGGSRYEWEQHAAIARDVGVTEAQIAGVPEWEKSSAFDDRQRAVLTFADELARNGDVTDETFARVGGFLNSTEVVELTMSTAFWSTMAHFLVTLRIDVEEGGGVFGRKR
ncbi:MAG: carboxymuconolactone decarboxylase family protein [Dehalococcoidia bacterium]|nr:carboxymuconolactone decarboxylase family protein [Dehalococcoidia bacterium]